MSSLKVIVNHNKVYELNEIWYTSRFYVRKVDNGYTIHFGRELFFFPDSKQFDHIGGREVVYKRADPWGIWFPTMFYAQRSMSGYSVWMGSELYYIPSDNRLERPNGFVHIQHKTIAKFVRTVHRFKKKNLRSLRKQCKKNLK